MPKGQCDGSACDGPQLLRRHYWWAALALGVAVATKPWAVAFVPLLLLVPRVRRSQAVLVTLGAAAVWWLPFLVADPQTIQASGSVNVETSADSTLHLLGPTHSASGPRLLQLMLMILVGLLVVRSGRWPALILAPVAVRMLTDPQTWLYYTSGLVLGAYVWDLLAGRSRWPRLTMLTAGLLLLESRISLQVNGPQHDGQTFLAVVRVVVLLGILAVVFWPGTRPAAQLPGNSGSDESVPDEAVAEEGATGAAPEQVPSV